MNQRIPELLEKANRLPEEPGVYLMHDETDKIIYIGKAKKLKNRVTSYFRGEHTPKVAAMVDKVDHFDIILADSELEALILENALIKQHKPHYNILLKDDKGYPFIRLDKTDYYPKFEIASRKGNDKAEYFGPYGARGRTRTIIESLNSAFMLPDCGKKFPDCIGKNRPCLNYSMKKCSGWCIPGADREEYLNRISKAENILRGKSAEIIAEMRTKMEYEAEQLNFEAAAELRDRISAITALDSKQKVFGTAFTDTDVVGFYRGEKCCFSILHFSDGNLQDKSFSVFGDPVEDDAELISNLVRQFYSADAAVVPSLVILPKEFPECGEIAEFLSSLGEKRVKVISPKRGDKAELADRANKNAKEEVLRVLSSEQKRAGVLLQLRDVLKLPAIPKRIEAFDISNLGNDGIVSGMTVFKDGKPLKSGYRKFRIKDMDVQNDYASMYQVIYRRFSAFIAGENGFTEQPDLILIDGGQVHAQTAVQALSDLSLSFPVYGMVKDSKHRTRALVTPNGEEIGIKNNQALFTLIGRIQEETHRFSITYQKSLRNESLKSWLDGIKGVGPGRKAALMEEFKTIGRIKKAGTEELKKVVPAAVAEEIYSFYHSNEEKE